MLSIKSYIDMTVKTSAKIGVQLIKYPDLSIEQLAAKVSEPGKQIESAMIRNFLQFHDLLKKTSATER